MAVVPARLAEACEACYGQADSPLIDGARSGVWLLLGVTILVELSLGAFFIFLWRRARRTARSAAVGSRGSGA